MLSARTAACQSSITPAAIRWAGAIDLATASNQHHHHHHQDKNTRHHASQACTEGSRSAAYRLDSHHHHGSASPSSGMGLTNWGRRGRLSDRIASAMASGNTTRRLSTAIPATAIHGSEAQGSSETDEPPSHAGPSTPTHSRSKPPSGFPHLLPTSFPTLNPSASPKATPHSRVTAADLARFTALLHDLASEGHELSAAYTRIAGIAGGEKLLTPQELSLLVERLCTTRTSHLLDLHARISTVMEIIEGGHRAMRRCHRSSREYREWSKSLGTDRTQSNLANLISNSMPRPSKNLIQEVVETVRKTSFGMEESADEGSRRRYASRAALAVYNVLLDILARGARIGRRFDQTDLDDFGDEDPLLSGEHPAPLRQVVQSEEWNDVVPSIPECRRLSYWIWNSMITDGIQPDDRAYLSRMLLECKSAVYEYCLARESVSVSEGGSLLEDDDAPDGTPDSSVARLSRRAHKQASKQGPRRRVTNLVAEMLDRKVLSTSHVNYILALYTSSLCVLRRAGVDGDGLESEIAGADAGEAPDVMRQVYEAMRLNEVRQEMAVLVEGETRLPSLREWASSYLAGLFHIPSRTPPRRTAQTEPPEPQGAWCALLGAHLPRHIIPDDATYGALIQYYATERGDYAQMVDILEDWRQADGDGDGHDGRELQGRGLSRRALTVPFLALIFKGFARHGVPSELVQSGAKPTRARNWRLDPSVDPASPAAQWNMANLLVFLHEFLQLKPAPSQAHLREQRYHAALRARERGRRSGNDEGEETAPSPSSGAGSATSSNSRSTIARRTYRSPTRTPRASADRAPTPGQVQFILTALRRCTGDAHDDVVLYYWEKIRAKFGGGADGEEAGAHEGLQAGDPERESERGAEQETAEGAHARWVGARNRQGWRGWKTNGPLRRTVEFLESRRGEAEGGWLREGE